MSGEIESHIREEREFLHDIATPLSSLSLSVDLVLSHLENTPPPVDKMRTKLEKVKIILEKLSEDLRIRRAQLSQGNEKSELTKTPPI